MIQIDYTCIKEGTYPVVKTRQESIKLEKKYCELVNDPEQDTRIFESLKAVFPVSEPESVVNPETDSPEIDYPDYDTDYGFTASVDFEIDGENKDSYFTNSQKNEISSEQNLDFDSELNDFNLQSWIKIIKAKYQRLHVLKEKSVNDKYLVWYCGKHQVRPDYIAGNTIVHTYSYPDLDHDIFAETFYECSEFFDSFLGKDKE